MAVSCFLREDSHLITGQSAGTPPDTAFIPLEFVFSAILLPRTNSLAGEV